MKSLMSNLLLLVVLISPAICNAQSKPNVIIILSDDAGYADFSFQSDRLIPTPNIDRIARNGVKFTNAYVTAAVCCPSRAGLLTGINQATFGNVINYIQGERYNIPKDSFGIPRNIKLVGDYLHPLGYRTGIVGKWHEGFSHDFHPNQRGFDYFWGFLWGSSPYFTGKAKNVEENGKPVSPNGIPYMTDAITDQALSFINNEKDHPFFLYVSYNAVHAPLQAKPEDIAKLKGKFADSIRVINGAMTYSLDENVGRIFKQLEELKLLDNTLIFFTNDNGGQKTVLHADNYPLRGMKGDPLEGGIRVPMAMYWKGKVKPGIVSDNIVSTLDFIPTIINAAGGNATNYPQLEGVDLVKLVNNESYAKQQQERTLYWELGRGKSAMRQGDWKLVVETGNKTSLYNLRKDIAEANDLFTIENSKAKAMLAKFKAWQNALPPMNYFNLDKDVEE